MDPSHLSPNFVIPIGTQVVLKSDHRVMGAVPGPDGERLFKKAGSVGIVVESPLMHEYAYVIRFADGHAVRSEKYGRADDFLIRLRREHAG